MNGALSWPQAWTALITELRTTRGLLALIEGDSSSRAALIGALRTQGATVASLGELIAGGSSPAEAIDAVAAAARTSTLVVADIDVLFMPECGLEPVPALRRIALCGPAIVSWPGRVAATRLTYSRVGRRDHFDEAARGMLVLRYQPATFPDDVPYTTERYAP